MHLGHKKYWKLVSKTTLGQKGDGNWNRKWHSGTKMLVFGVENGLWKQKWCGPVKKTDKHTLDIKKFERKHQTPHGSRVAGPWGSTRPLAHTSWALARVHMTTSLRGLGLGQRGPIHPLRMCLGGGHTPHITNFPGLHPGGGAVEPRSTRHPLSASIGKGALQTGFHWQKGLHCGKRDIVGHK